MNEHPVEAVDQVEVAQVEKNYHAEILDGRKGYPAIREEWQVLVDSVPDAPWYYQPEVFRSWTSKIRPDDRTRIVAVRDGGGQLRGVMPISLDFAWRGPAMAPRFDYDPRDKVLINLRRPRPIPVRQLTTMSSMPATLAWVAPLCATCCRAAVSMAIAQAFLGLNGWWVAVIPAFEIDDAEHWCAAFKKLGVSAKIQRLDRVVQDIRHLQPFDDIVATQKKKFRQNVRRARSSAEKDGLRFEFYSGADAVVGHLPTIEAIARASWKHEGRTETDVHIRYAGEQQAFVETLLRSKNLGVRPVLGTVSDENGILAILLMLQHGKTLTALLTFWDGRKPRASPGLLLLGESIDWAVREKLQQYDFNATAPWVRYIVDSRREVCNVIAFAPNPAGRCLSALSALLRRLL